MAGFRVLSKSKAPSLALIEDCPRCEDTIPLSEGGSDTPLCDPCWADLTPYWHGYWAGKSGWGADSRDEAYLRGFERGKAHAEAV